MEKLWQLCLEKLSQEITPEQISTWISPLEPQDFDADASILTLVAPNPVKRRVAERYRGPIQEAARSIFQDGDLKIEFVLPPAPHKKPIGHHLPSAAPANGVPTPPPPVSSSSAAAAGAHASEPSQPADKLDSLVNQPLSPSAASAPKRTPVIETLPPQDKSDLQQEHTFENLVVGKSNELVLAAAKNIAENPGESGRGNAYNPFYIYGSTGLGKTHIMHAIGNYVRKTRPETKIRFMSSETYYRGMVNAYRYNAVDDWQRGYQSIDLLLIDDIQFFRNKDRTQENFFYLFENMVNRQKQIVMTSDTYPRDLKQMEQRLITRFSMGLSLSVEPPELEMRVAILHSKAQMNPRIRLTDDAAFFIANHVRSNVRELEGALTKVSAFASFQNRTEITVDLCRDALRDLITSSSTQITIDSIKNAVAEYYRIKVSDLDSNRRHASVVLPRQVAMFLAKQLTTKSLPNIGEQFGNRNHTTVMHACRKIRELRSTDNELNHQIHVLEQLLKG